MSVGPRILLLDIETRPAKVWAWGLFKQYISINQVIEPTGMLCWAAKWYDEKQVFWHKNDFVGLVALWHLLDEADIVVHYNGVNFDVPRINAEFIQADLEPPSPYKQVDLYTTIKRKFEFTSGKLQFVSEALGLEGKIATGGFDLWIKCMEGDEKAWKRMEKYNRRDVTMLEPLYKKLLPWIPSHPSLSSLTGLHVCPRCGSGQFQRRGSYVTATSRYVKLRCSNCGGYSRETHREVAALVIPIND